MFFLFLTGHQNADYVKNGRRLGGSLPQHQGIKICGHPRYHQVTRVHKQALQKPRLLSPAKVGKKGERRTWDSKRFRKRFSMTILHSCISSLKTRWVIPYSFHFIFFNRQKLYHILLAAQKHFGLQNLQTVEKWKNLIHETISCEVKRAMKPTPPERVFFLHRFARQHSWIHEGGLHISGNQFYWTQYCKSVK